MMSQHQRLELIMRLISNTQYVEVDELAKNIGVSQMTIRRDLDRLSSVGLIERYHGGARYPQSMTLEIDLDNKSKVHTAEKKLIAARALELIEDGESVFLDGGTTNFEIANLIKLHQKPITVFTVDLMIASLLCDSPVNLILIGGEVLKTTKSTAGSITCELISRFRFSKSFLGASSIDDDFSIFTPTIEKAYMKRAVIDVSMNTYVVADESKFYLQAKCKIINLSQVTGVITEKRFSAEVQEKLKKLNINIINV